VFSGAALAPLGGSAQAAVVSVTYIVLDSAAVSDFNNAPPVLAQNLGPDGLPVVTNTQNYNAGVDINAKHELLFFSPSGPDETQVNLATPVVTSTASSVAVNAFPSAIPNGDYAVISTAVFSSPTAGVSPLNVDCDSCCALWLNGSLIRSQDTGPNAANATINEILLAGTNTLTAVYFSDGARSVFSYDPELPAARFLARLRRRPASC
jgi:hypothetical protein